MTAIVPEYIKTKKQLKAIIASGDDICFVDPNPWGNEYPSLKGMEPNEVLYVTNHPRRSWFASITCISPGTYKVQ